MNRVMVWVQAGRAGLLTAAVVPVFVGVGAAVAGGGDVRWSMLWLVLFCSVMFQAGTNMVNDYYDFKNGIDTVDSYGSSRCLVEGLLEPMQMLIGGCVAFLLGIAGGLVLVYYCGWFIFLLGVIGFLGGVFYTAVPVGYKYYALGDVGVFLLMGPMMVVGSYYCLAGGYDGWVVWLSVPVGFLVTAILQANNVRDMEHDRNAGVASFALLVGHSKARYGYIALVVGAYVSVGLMCFFGVVSWWAMVVFLSLPMAYKNVSVMWGSVGKGMGSVVGLDIASAKVHLLFGVLLALGICLGKMFS